MRMQVENEQLVERMQGREKCIATADSAVKRYGKREMNKGGSSSAITRAAIVNSELRLTMIAHEKLRGKSSN